jgi:hypothetical protein
MNEHIITKPVKQTTHWVLKVAGTPAGETQHSSLEFAKTEAKRLFIKEGRTVTIYKAVTVIGLPPDLEPYVYELREAEPLWPDEEFLHSLFTKPFIKDTYENREQIKCNDLGFAYECLLSNGEVVKATYINYQQLGWCYAGTFKKVKPDVVGFIPTQEEATSDEKAQ